MVGDCAAQEESPSAPPRPACKPSRPHPCPQQQQQQTEPPQRQANAAPMTQPFPCAPVLPAALAAKACEWRWLAGVAKPGLRVALQCHPRRRGGGGGDSSGPRSSPTLSWSSRGAAGGPAAASWPGSGLLSRGLTGRQLNEELNKFIFPCGAVAECRQPAQGRW